MRQLEAAMTQAEQMESALTAYVRADELEHRGLRDETVLSARRHARSLALIAWGVRDGSPQ